MPRSLPEPIIVSDEVLPTSATLVGRVPKPASPEKRLSRAAEPLDTFLEFVVKGGAEEVKKLPGGSWIVAGAEILAARLGKEIDRNETIEDSERLKIVQDTAERT